MRVVLADDSALFRGGLRLLLATADVEVAAEAGTAAELLAAVAEDPPDVAIVDIRMPPTCTDEGLRAAEALGESHPEVGVLVLSTYTETDYAVRLLGNGTRGVGYLLKDRVDNVESLLDVLDRICKGESVIDPEVVEHLLARQSREQDLGKLSVRERQVLEHMAEGRSNAGIGAALHLSSKTVESHVANVFTKLHLPAAGDDNRRVQAVLRWLRATADG